MRCRACSARRPELLDAVHQAVVPMRTVAEKRRELANFLSAGHTTFGDDGHGVREPHRPAHRDHHPAVPGARRARRRRSRVPGHRHPDQHPVRPASSTRCGIPTGTTAPGNSCWCSPLTGCTPGRTARATASWRARAARPRPSPQDVPALAPMTDPRNYPLPRTRARRQRRTRWAAHRSGQDRPNPRPRAQCRVRTPARAGGPGQHRACRAGARTGPARPPALPLLPAEAQPVAPGRENP